MTRVKICGITSADDAMLAASLGASALGFIFFKKSQRFVSPYKAKKIIGELPPFVTPVGVFVNQKEGAVRDIAEFCGLQSLQFHGEETPAYCRRFNRYKVIKAFRVKPDFDVAVVKEYRPVVSAFLFDTYREDTRGGSGKTFNWKLIAKAKDFGRPVILSGGLTADNALNAINEIFPYAIDLSSGVEESPGKKSRQALENFFAKIFS